MFTLREYQQHALDALRTYFQACVQLNNAGTPQAANLAFYQCTLENFGVGVPYQPISDLKGLPYVCLRIPTGGGKTFVACHAGPPLSKTKPEKIINIRKHPDLLHDLMWNRIRRPGRPSGYAASDVKRFRKSLKLDKHIPFLVSHTPFDSEGTLWCDVAGIENHHVVYSSRAGEVSIFVGVNGRLAPQLYSAEPMLDLVNRRAEELMDQSGGVVGSPG